MLILSVVYAHTSRIACPRALMLMTIVEELATASAATCTGEAAWLHTSLRWVMIIASSWWLLMTRVRICLHWKNMDFLFGYKLCGGRVWYCYNNESWLEWNRYCQDVWLERMSLRYLSISIEFAILDSTFGKVKCRENMNGKINYCFKLIFESETNRIKHQISFCQAYYT